MFQLHQKFQKHLLGNILLWGSNIVNGEEGCTSLHEIGIGRMAATNNHPFGPFAIASACEPTSIISLADQPSLQCSKDCNHLCHTPVHHKAHNLSRDPEAQTASETMQGPDEEITEDTQKTSGLSTWRWYERLFHCERYINFSKGSSSNNQHSKICSRNWTCDEEMDFGFQLPVYSGSTRRHKKYPRRQGSRLPWTQGSNESDKALLKINEPAILTLCKIIRERSIYIANWVLNLIHIGPKLFVRNFLPCSKRNWECSWMYRNLNERM